MAEFAGPIQPPPPRLSAGRAARQHRRTEPAPTDDSPSIPAAAQAAPPAPPRGIMGPARAGRGGRGPGAERGSGDAEDTGGRGGERGRLARGLYGRGARRVDARVRGERRPVRDRRDHRRVGRGDDRRAACARAPVPGRSAPTGGGLGRQSRPGGHAGARPGAARGRGPGHADATRAAQRRLPARPGPRRARLGRQLGPAYPRRLRRPGGDAGRHAVEHDGAALRLAHPPARAGRQSALRAVPPYRAGDARPRRGPAAERPGLGPHRRPGARLGGDPVRLPAGAPGPPLRRPGAVPRAPVRARGQRRPVLVLRRRDVQQPAHRPGLAPHSGAGRRSDQPHHGRGQPAAAAGAVRAAGAALSGPAQPRARPRGRRADREQRDPVRPRGAGQPARGRRGGGDGRAREPRYGGSRWAGRSRAWTARRSNCWATSRW